MPCDCCCVKTLKLCKVSACDDIDLGITAQVSGSHKLIVDFLGREITITKSIAANAQITFPASVLNENFTFTGKLYDPNGTQIVIRKDDIDYDCVEFKIVANVTIAA